jgi:hypothetical protein
VRARFPEPLPEGAGEVAALWPHLVLEGRRLDLLSLRFPWGRAFEAEPRLGWVPADRGPFLVR